MTLLRLKRYWFAAFFVGISDRAVAYFASCQCDVPMRRHSAIKAQMWSALIFLSLSRVSCAWAQDVGDPHRGHALATTVCAACHAVEATEYKSPDPLAPNFAQIANTKGMTALALRVALRSPHPVMPNLKTTERELKDIVAYIKTLKKE